MFMSEEEETRAGNDAADRRQRLQVRSNGLQGLFDGIPWQAKQHHVRLGYDLRGVGRHLAYLALIDFAIGVDNLHVPTPPLGMGGEQIHFDLGQTGEDTDADVSQVASSTDTDSHDMIK